jgi:hypothetical protein
LWRTKISADLYCEKGPKGQGFLGARVLKLERGALDFNRERRISKNECKGHRDYEDPITLEP